MKKLYNANGYIKVELIESALLNAKNEGKLPNVRREKIKYFMESLEEEMEKFRSKVGAQINKDEVRFLFRQIARDKHDKITDSELRIIEEILSDKDFDIE